MHIFDLYRRLLMIICTVYAAVRLGQSAWRWSGRLGGQSRQSRLLRGYVAVMAASIRIRRFGPELLQIVALLVLLGLLVYAHLFVMT